MDMAIMVPAIKGISKYFCEVTNTMLEKTVKLITPPILFINKKWNHCLISEWQALPLNVK